jgi:hypothetical protein
MASGLAATTLANKWLDVLGAAGPAAGTTFTGITSNYVQLHTGEPGAAGTSLVSSVTTRVVMNWAAAAAGSKAIQATFPAWANWAGTNGEIVTNISVWDALTSGNFLFSVLLTASKTVNTGDTLTLTSLSISFTPIAA